MILERGVKPNDYSITILERRGSSQMITFDYIGGRGVPKISKNDYVILEQPLMFIDEMKAIVVVDFEINQQIVR